MSSFQEISNLKIQKIISTIETLLSEDIDVDIIENGLIYFYKSNDENYKNNHCVLSVNNYKQEIWFSSPKLGPSHWSLTSEKKWFDKRENRYNLEEIVISGVKLLIVP